MKDYFAEENPTKRDAIAAHQLSVLGQYQNPRDGKLRLSDIKAMFRQMRESRPSLCPKLLREKGSWLYLVAQNS